MAFWFWFFTAPALLLAFLSLRGERKRAEYVARRLNEIDSATFLPPATVIVPVKGKDQGLRENLASLAALDYPDYELIVVAHRAADIPPGVLPARVRVVLAHGADPSTGEKVQNLQAAVRAARKRSELFAFADSDGRVTRRWLRSLAAPLADETVGGSTGYRWFTPEPPTFWSLLSGVWDAVCAGMVISADSRFAWGGAMAIRKETFFGARLPEFWKNTISDDFAFADAIHTAGLKIAYAPGALVPCNERLRAFEFLAWARRQMTITRIYRPSVWWPALIAHMFYCGGMAAAIIASIKGYRLAEWALVAQLSPGMLKGLNRATLAKASLPEYEPWFKRHSWVHAIWVPLATWIWLAVLVASAFGNTVNWRGYSYKLSRPSR